MRIGVVGLNGRMSKVILEELENHPNCSISGALVRKKSESYFIPVYEDILELAAESDAIIDFSNSTTSIYIAKKLAGSNIVLVCGTTGFSSSELKELEESATQVTLIYSPNMSIGINLLQNLLKIAAPILSEFDPAIIDIHHKHKKDSPSGTALLLAKKIEETISKKVQVSSLRIGAVPGEHQVIFSSEDESIAFTHHAFNRNVFANGAIKACLWGKGREPGKLYSMQDVLNS